MSPDPYVPSRPLLLFRLHPWLVLRDPETCIESLQPPLAFYLNVMGRIPWTSVSFVTGTGHPSILNPTFRIMEQLNNQGLLGSNVETFKVRWSSF